MLPATAATAASGTTVIAARACSRYIMKQELLDGQTGKVAFDENGDRVNAEYDVMNVKENQVQEAVGHFFYSREQNRMRLSLDDNAILWPGRLRTKPEGFMIPTHLKVLTIAEKPFVYVREADLCNADEIPCPHFNSSDDCE